MFGGGRLTRKFLSTLGDLPSRAEADALLKDFETYMRPWDEVIERHRSYDEAMTQWLEFQQWAAVATPTKTLPPLGEDDVASGLMNGWYVGCDPEFVMLDAAGRIVNVSETLNHDGPAGWDHSGDVIEIRPQPAHGTYKLLQRIQDIVLNNPGLIRLRDYKWRAGAYVRARSSRLGRDRILTLGGHVHIDQPAARGEETHEHRIKALDRVTEWLEGLDILPGAESAQRRNDPTAIQNRYGQFGDWRPAGGGSARPRMEYRTMCSWLYDPRAAYLALTGVKLAAQTPQIAMECLKKGRHSWPGLANWFDQYRTKDLNARRALERLFDDKTHPPKMDPTSAFRDNWTKLGV